MGPAVALAPLDAAGSRFAGTVSWEGGLVLRFAVEAAGGRWRSPRLLADHELSALFGPKLRVRIAERLRASSSAQAFSRELESELQGGAAGDLPSLDVMSAAQASRAIHMVKAAASCGWDCVRSLDLRRGAFKLRLRDARRRRHTVRVTLPEGYPAVPPAVEMDVPTQPEVVGAGRSSLVDVKAACEAVIADLQPLWHRLDEVDAALRVLEPEAPTRRDCHRRVAIGQHCSMRVDLDPARPLGVPRIQLFGAEAITGPMHRAFLRASTQWDESGGLVASLERALGTSFPRRRRKRGRKGKDGKEEEEREEEEEVEDGASVECGICYTYRLPTDDGTAAAASAEGVEPDVSCANARCGRQFHRPCLVEWLRGLPTTRQSFVTLFGACPYCGEGIRVAAS